MRESAMIMVACPGCDKPLKVPLEQAGKRGQCPRCKIVFGIPAADGQRSDAASFNGVVQSSVDLALQEVCPMQMKFTCPKCRSGLSVPSELAGRVHPCPTCGQPLKIPVASNGSGPAQSTHNQATPPPTLSDEQLSAHLRGRAGRPAGHAQNRLFRRLKNRYQAAVVRRDIHSLEESIRAELVEVAVRVLETHVADTLPLDQERGQLKQLVAEIENRNARLDALTRVNGGRRLGRELQSQLRDLEDRRDEVLAGIGNAVCTRQLPDDATCGRISNLSSMLQQRQRELVELDPASLNGRGATRAAKSATRLARAPAFLVKLAFVLGLGAVGYLLAQRYLLDDFRRFRFAVPPNSEFVAVIDVDQLRQSEGSERDYVKKFDAALDAGLQSEGLELERSAIDTLFIAARDDGALMTIVCNSPLRVTEGARDHYREQEYKDATLWTPHDNSDSFHIADANTVLLGPRKLIEDALDARREGITSQSATSMCRWLRDAPGDGIRCVITAPKDPPGLRNLVPEDVRRAEVILMGLRDVDGSLGWEWKLQFETDRDATNAAEALEIAFDEQKKTLEKGNAPADLQDRIDLQRLLKSVEISRSSRSVTVISIVPTKKLEPGFEQILRGLREGGK